MSTSAIATLYATITARTTKFVKGMQAASDAAEAAAATIDEAATKINAAWEGIAEKVSATADAADSAAEGMAASTEDSAAGITASLREVTAAYTEAAAAATKSLTAMSAAADGAAAKNAASSTKAKAAAEESSTSLKDAAAGASGALTTMAERIGIGFGLSGLASLKFATDFQAAVTRLYTQAGLGQQALAQLGLSSDQFNQKLLSMGTQAGYTGTEVADALYHPISAGLDLQSALNVTTDAMKEARISGADLEQTSFTLSTVMKGFNLSADQSAQTMATLNAMVGNGDTTFQDLNESIKNWVPTANALGVSLTSVGAGLDYLTDRGDSASTAGTKLAMMMAMMAGQSKQAAGYMEDLGLTTDKVQVAQNAMGEALQKSGLTQTKLADDLRKPDGLYVALNDLQTQMQKAGVSANEANGILVKAFGGGKSFKSVAELMANLGGLQQKFTDLTQQGSVSSWESAWQKTTDTMSFQLHRLKAGAENAATALGEKLLPTATKLLSSGMSKLSSLWHKASPDVGQVMAGFRGQASASGLNQLGQGLRGIVDDLKRFGHEASKAFGIFLRAMEPAAKVIGAELLVGLKAFAMFLANVVGPAMIKFANFLKEHKSLVELLAGVLGTKLLGILLRLGSTTLIKSLMGLASPFTSFFGSVKKAKKACDEFNAVVTGVKGAKQVTALSSEFAKVATGFNKLGGLVTKAAGIGKKAGTALADGVGLGAKKIASNVTGPADTMQYTLEMSAQHSGEALTDAAENASAEGGKALGGLKKAAVDTAGKIGDLAKSGWSKIGSLAKSGLGMAKTAMDSLKSGAMQAGSKLLSLGASAAKTGAAAVRAAANFALEKGALIATSIAEKAAAAAEWLLNAAMNANPIIIIVGLIALLIGAVIYCYNKFAWFRNFIQDCWDAIKKAFSIAWGVVKQVFDDIVGGIMGGIKGAIDWLSSAWSTCWNTLKSVALDIWHFIDNNIIQPIESAISSVGSALSSVGNAISDVGSFLGFDEGGVVPGAPGQPMLAVVHGGEYVLSNKMLAGQQEIRLPGSSSLGKGAPYTPSRGMLVGGGGGAQQVNNQVVVVNIAGTVTAEKQLVTAVQQGLLQYNARNQTNGTALSR